MPRRAPTESELRKFDNHSFSKVRSIYHLETLGNFEADLQNLIRKFDDIGKMNDSQWNAEDKAALEQEIARVNGILIDAADHAHCIAVWWKSQTDLVTPAQCEELRLIGKRLWTMHDSIGEIRSIVHCHESSTLAELKNLIAKKRRLRICDEKIRNAINVLKCVIEPHNGVPMRDVLIERIRTNAIKSYIYQCRSSIACRPTDSAHSLRRFI